MWYRCAVMALAGSVALTAWGQELDLQELVTETQKLEQDENSFQLVWWIPTEYWEASFQHAPSLTEQQKQEFYDAVDEYFVLAIVDAKTTNLGTIDPRSREEIVGGLSVTNDSDQALKPLPDEDVNGDARNLFSMMKPFMANMLGQFGQGMEFICFEGTDADGNEWADPTDTGSFLVHLGDAEFHWRLPLGSVLPPKFDPGTGERFPGNYLYSPFTGKELVAKPPETEQDE